jgi:hypothetical protein
VEQINQEDIRKMSICFDLALIKDKYKLESVHRDSLLDELLKDEVEDSTNSLNKVILEEAPQEQYEVHEQYEVQEQLLRPENTINEENLPRENENPIDEDWNNENKDLVEPDYKDEPSFVTELEKPQFDLPDIQLKESKSDLKSYLLSFGDGNLNLFKEFSQTTFKINLVKNDKNKKLFKVEEPQQPKVIKGKENALFDFKAENVPTTKDIFKGYAKSSNVDGRPFWGKKRKIL